MGLIAKCLLLSTALWYSCVCVLWKLREMVFERYSVNAGESWHGARTQLQDSLLLPSFSEMFLKKKKEMTFVIFSPKKIHSNRLPAFPYKHRHTPNLPVLMSLHYLLDFKVKQRVYDY